MALNLSLCATVRPTSCAILPTATRTRLVLASKQTCHDKLVIHDRFRVGRASEHSRKQSNLPTLVSGENKLLVEHSLTIPSQSLFLDLTGSGTLKPRANEHSKRHSSISGPVEKNARLRMRIALQQCSRRPDDVRPFTLSSRYLRIRLQ